MRFVTTAVAGAWLIEIEPRADDRGFFARAWCEREFAEHGIQLGAMPQANMSYTESRGTLRGLHWQGPPSEEAKLVRCTRGAVFDAVADVRVGSPTFGCWTGFELTAQNRRQFYVPAGCAHGYLTLTDETEVFYTVSSSYTPSLERGIRWDDPFFRIRWPERPTHLTGKDRAWPDYVPQRSG